MPRKAKDEAEEKMPKPKILFKMNFQIFDNGVVDSTLFERYENEETGRWKQQTCNTPLDFKEAVEREICEKPEYIGIMVLKQMGIDPQKFARSVLNVPAPSIQEPETEDETEDEPEAADLEEVNEVAEEEAVFE